MKHYLLTTAILLNLGTTAMAVTPDQILPDNQEYLNRNGIKARKGTIAATIKNVLQLDDLLNNNGSEEKIREILEDQKPLVQGLYAADLFKLYPIEDWLNEPERPGKAMVAVLTLQKCPELMTDKIRDVLQKLMKTSHPLLKEEIQKVIPFLRNK